MDDALDDTLADLPWPDPLPHLVEALGAGEAPATIGPYQILGVLGRGGMGVVYHARQAHPQRDVALKVLHPGLDQPQVARRFALEIATLARLEHRGIARLYEAGEELMAGVRVPYFAMERVIGVPITRFAAERDATIAQRLQLMVAVCDAVQHAHVLGVVHRDLKPANVLVTDAGEPKILDFGIARVSGMHTSLHTEIGQILGTVAYMSPEQMAGDPRLVGEQSDVYALGAITYELLTGRLPLDVRNKQLAEAARIIRDEEPLPPGSIDRALGGDLEAILLTALDKDVRRRYPSAAAFAADLQRHLRDESVLARPPTLRTTAGRLIRRYRNAALAGGAIAITLLAATAVSIEFARRSRVAEREARAAEQNERDQRQRAERQLLSLRRVNEFLVDLFAAADPFAEAPAAGRDVTVGQALEQAAGRLDGAFPDDADVEVSVRSAIASGFSGIGRFTDAQSQLERALQLHEAARGLDATTTRLRLQGSLGVVRVWQGAHAEGIDLLREVLDQQRANLGEHSRDSIYTRNNLAWALHKAGRFADAAPLIEETYAIGMQVLPETDDLRLRGATTRAMMQRRKGDLDGARQTLTEALALGAARYPIDHPVFGVLRNNLARVEQQQGDLAAAADDYREAARVLRRVGHHPSLATTLNNLGMALLDLGDPAAAETALLESLDIYAESVGEQSGDYMGTLNNLAIVYLESGAFAKAEAALIRYRDFLRERTDAAPWRLLLTEASLAECTHELGRSDEAERELLRCYASLQAIDPTSKALPSVARMLVRFYESTGRPDQAAPYRTAALPPPTDD